MDDILSAISARLTGQKPGASRTKALEDVLSLGNEREAMLREAAARKLLESDRFRSEGSSPASRIIRGAAMGAQTGVSLPSRGNSGLAGIVAGISALSGLQGQETEMGNQKEEAATSALSNLIAEDRAKQTLALKGETDRGDTVSRLLDHADAIRVLNQGDAPKANEIAHSIGGINYAITPKPDTGALIKLMSMTGKNSDELMKTYLQLYKSANDTLQKPKTAMDTTERARAVEQARMSRNVLAGTFGIKLPDVVEMTAEEKAPQSGFAKLVTALSGGQDLPRARMATPLDAVDGLGITPELASRIPQRELTLIQQQADPKKQATLVQLATKKYGVPKVVK